MIATPLRANDSNHDRRPERISHFFFCCKVSEKYYTYLHSFRKQQLLQIYQVQIHLWTIASVSGDKMTQRNLNDFQA